MEVNGRQNCLVTNILENILFYVPQKKGYHKGLEDMRSDYPFKIRLIS